MAMHAGHSETALMLALAPECVHMARAVANFPPPFPCPTLSKAVPRRPGPLTTLAPAALSATRPRHSGAGPGAARIPGRQLGAGD